MFRSRNTTTEPLWTPPVLLTVAAIAAITGAELVGVVTGIVGLPLMLVLAAAAVVWVPLRRRMKAAAAAQAEVKRREQLRKVAEEQRMREFADQAIQTVLRLQNIQLPTQPNGWPVLQSTVYQAPHELDDPLTMRILAELTERTGDIPRSADPL